MKKVLIFALALVMLLACVACSNNNQTDNTDTTSGSELPPINNTMPGQNENPSGNNGNDGNDTGYKPQMPADLPVELRAPITDRSYWSCTKKPFEANDPRKVYLENKYGVTAYLLEHPGNPEFNATGTHFALEGFEDAFKLYSPEQLIAIGVPEEYQADDYVDNAWFAVMYPEIQAYFAKIVQDSGMTVDRVIVECKVLGWKMYDIHQPFADSLKTASKDKTTFNLYIYGGPENDVWADATQNLLWELEDLNLQGRVTYYKVLEDISDVPTYEVFQNSKYGKRLWDSKLTN